MHDREVVDRGCGTTGLGPSGSPGDPNPGRTRINEGSVMRGPKMPDENIVGLFRWAS